MEASFQTIIQSQHISYALYPKELRQWCDVIVYNEVKEESFILNIIKEYQKEDLEIRKLKLFSYRFIRRVINDEFSEIF
jgi:hypothetical protein